MTRKISIVGSKSLDGYETIYRTIDNVVTEELENRGPFTLVNGGEEGVDLMAAEIVLSRGWEYELVPLLPCQNSCVPGKTFCFEHSFKPRSETIAREADVIYRIFDESCGFSTCEVTASFGDEFGKKVIRIPMKLPILESIGKESDNNSRRTTQVFS